MDVITAKKILRDNCSGEEGTLTNSMNDRNTFSEEYFRELFESIAGIASHGLYNEELSEQISTCVQWFLKELIYHFDPGDGSVVKDLPKNYVGYVELLDIAQMAYFKKDPNILADCGFDRY